jgi:hypothetical protein
MNVWTVVLRGKRFIAAAGSRDICAEVIGCSYNHMRNFGAITHDPDERRMALAAPNTKIEIAEGLARGRVYT